jgi:hypothetical protein
MRKTWTHLFLVQTELVTMETSGMEKVCQTHKQQRVEQWFCQLNVAEVTRATSRMLTTTLASGH